MNNKIFLIDGKDIKKLIVWDGPEGCLATDRILVDGAKVGYMYREEPSSSYPDSGWRFLAGDKDDEYLDNIDNIAVYAINTIVNYDPEIIPFLNAPFGSAFYRNEEGVLQEDLFED